MIRGETMKKIITITHFSLIVYALVHIGTQFQLTSLLQDMIQLDADPSLLMVFNLLGLFPLAFLLFGIQFLPMTLQDKIFLGLGFGLGGFILTVPFIKNELSPRPVSQKVHLGALFGLIGAVATLGYGLILGDLDSYMNAFIADSFVHIMTIDFLFLYLLSILLSRQVFKQYWLSFIPVIGFFYLIFQNELK